MNGLSVARVERCGLGLADWAARAVREANIPGIALAWAFALPIIAYSPYTGAMKHPYPNRITRHF